MNLGAFIRRLQTSAAAQPQRQRLRIFIDRDELDVLILRLKNAQQAVQLRDRRADPEQAQWADHTRHRRQQRHLQRGRV